MCDEASALGETALLENGAWKTPDPHTQIHTHANSHTHTRTHTCPVHPALLLRYGDGK